jgi:precorrin-6B methylase 2
MERPDWAPADVDIERPSAARMWDYLLGGAHNFAVDRRVAEQGIALKPDLPEVARQVRAFIHRAVAYLSDAGVDQFIDIGAGIPTRGSVHEMAQRANPEARVVYVDRDPVAIAHSTAILRDNDRATAILGDLRDPAAILARPELRDLLDLDRPVGLLLVAVLHFVFDEDEPERIVATLRDALPVGSHLVIQHATLDEQPATVRQMVEHFNANSAQPMQWRTREEITAFLDGYTILDPGVVHLSRWRPLPENVVPDPVRYAAYTAVGRKDTAR